MRLLIGGAMALALVACGDHSSATLSGDGDGDDVKSREAILAELAAKPEGDNIVWSAASLDGLLTLVGLGYDDERQQLLSTYLGSSIEDKAKATSLLNVSREGLTVQSANNIWTRPDFKLNEAYQSALSKYFDGLKPQQMDVTKPQETADKINQWASDNTNEMIRKVISPDMITADLASLLANALYFKGDWHEQFDPQLTEELDFKTVSKGSNEVAVKKVATMKKPAAKIEVGETGEYTTIRLPYKGETHAMYLAFASKKKEQPEGFAPDVTEVDPAKDVADVYRRYIIEGEAFRADYSAKSEYDLFTMPKFTIETKLDGIHQVLAAGGYDGLFARGVLSRMTDDQRAQLSFILQKAKIIVNEEGSEAAAVTIGGVVTTSVRTPQYLTVNGPFAFAIRDESNGVTLFEGMVRSPEAGL